MHKLSLQTDKSYNIYIDSGLLGSADLRNTVSSLAARSVIITDENLIDPAKTLAATLNAQVFMIPAGEANKTRETKAILEDQLLQAGYTRDTVIVALGGGVVTDLAGFIAATYCRGVPCVYVPTSLLAMVDASIGGKTGVNTKFGKNLIGAFSQPAAVFIDTDFLATLPEAEFINGMVELIKHAVIYDESLFYALMNSVDGVMHRDRHLLNELIYHSCQIKAKIVERDVEERKGVRQILNFGHTVGHAIEKVSDYKLRHGEAVALGMLAATTISAELGLLAEQNLELLQQLLQRYQVPLTMPELDKAELIKAMQLDKKSEQGELRVVLLKGIGEVAMDGGSYTHVIAEDAMIRALGSL